MSKPLAAVRTNKWLFTRVLPLMLLQFRVEVECSGTALEGTRRVLSYALVVELCRWPIESIDVVFRITVVHYALRALFLDRVWQFESIKATLEMKCNS